MIGRRLALKGVLAMTGDGLRRPVNAPPGQAVSPGVQPGVTGGIVLARYVIVTGAGGGVFIYVGTPGFLNPPAAWLGASGADPYGNPLPTSAGVTELLIKPSPALPPPNPGASQVILYNDANGNLQYVNPIDGGSYMTGRVTQFGNSGQLISSTIPTAVSGMSVPVAAGSRYHLTGAVNFTGTAAAGTAQFTWGPATLSHADGMTRFFNAGGWFGLSIVNGVLGLSGSGTMSGAIERWEFDLDVVVSGGTQLGVLGNEGVAGDSFTVNSGYLRSEVY